MDHFFNVGTFVAAFLACGFPTAGGLTPCDETITRPASGQPVAPVNENLFEKLSKFRDSDLRHLEAADADRLLNDLQTFVPKRAYKGDFRSWRLYDNNGFKPWYLWETGTEKNPVLTLVEVQNTGFHPGSTNIRLTQIDNTGKILDETTFDTGHRCYVTGGIKRVGNDEHTLFILGTTWFSPGCAGDITARQYYAKIGKRYDLIRVETWDGEPVRNEYYIKHFRHGPVAVSHTVDEWVSELESGDRLRILRALVWLGGVHRDLQAGDQLDRWREDRQGIELVRAVRKNEKVITRLKKLVQVKDRWLRDAATLALQPQDQQSSP